MMIRSKENVMNEVMRSLHCFHTWNKSWKTFHPLLVKCAVSLVAVCSSPRCTKSRMSVWGHSRRSDSRRHSPCSRCRGHSGRSVDQSRLGGRDTDRWCGRSDSRWMMDSWRVRCPAGCRHTLWTRIRLDQNFIARLHLKFNRILSRLRFYWRF